MLKYKCMKSEENKNIGNVMTISGEEFLRVGEIAKTFFEKVSSAQPPSFVILMGGIGSGKTAIRREKFSEGYVNFDSGEINKAVEDSVGKDNPRLMDYSWLAMDIILKECILEKKNIVIEIIGDNYDQITPVIDKMKEIGYEVQVNGIISDVAESYKRHLLATKEDKNYISSYYTQGLTLLSFFNYFGLGKFPNELNS